MTFKLFARGATVSATAVAVALFGAGVAFASPDTVSPDNQANDSSQQQNSKNNESATSNPGNSGSINSKNVSNSGSSSSSSSGLTGKTARNNDNGLDWGDDWSLGGFPPINLSSMQPPEATVAIPLSLGLPGLSLPSLVVDAGLGGLVTSLAGLALGNLAAPASATIAGTQTLAPVASAATFGAMSAVGDIAKVS
ncbi:hypothetical protein FZI93_20335, partial [Mycobacterium sp. CBMA361]|nr:hypothetical protein [Mycolicibacterium sp. CBMA 361]